MKFNNTSIKEKLAKLQALLPAAIENALLETSEEGVRIATTKTYYTSRGSNGLKDNTYWKRISGNHYQIIANKPYASFVNFGTRPHVIYPKKSKLLHFKINGKDVYAKYVNHPGTKPYPFFSNMVKEIIPLLYINIKNNIRGIL